MQSVTIITDGSCLGNPGPGGWAAILKLESTLQPGQYHKRVLTGHEKETTNNRMELTAAIKGLLALNRPCEVTVITDSNYVRLGITEWISAWKAKGWKTSQKKPVLNQDLWQALDQAVNTLGHKVIWVWTKGHAGHCDNEECDQLAQQAARRAE